MCLGLFCNEFSHLEVMNAYVSKKDVLTLFITAYVHFKFEGYLSRYYPILFKT